MHAGEDSRVTYLFVVVSREKRVPKNRSRPSGSCADPLSSSLHPHVVPGSPEINKAAFVASQAVSNEGGDVWYRIVMMVDALVWRVRGRYVCLDGDCAVCTVFLQIRVHVDESRSDVQLSAAQKV